MRVRVLMPAILLGTLLSAVGCHVQVDKGKNGEDKTVRIDTPLGGLHVRSDQTSAVDLGLPMYPGAQITPDKDGDKSADVHLGFGQWQVRVEVVSYDTPDAKDKVVAFYKNAMGRFGDVIECQGSHAVGKLAITGEGLSCNEESKGTVHVDGMDNDSGLTLRAGSRRHQHIFALKNSEEGTRFALIELQLPSGLVESSSKTSD
ncbi:MAG TPA: hypothetical protein VHX13_07260 [Acidobacteriaceae bacterium]|jgi:hypothetical protein|nr:hypothetical protein [Acidobacteriaceae bacterium]